MKISSPAGTFAKLGLALYLLSPHPVLANDSPSTPIQETKRIDLTDHLRARLKFETLSVEETHEKLNFPAKVELDEHNVARIGPSISGRVIEIKAREGDRVKRGEVLATLSSVDLSNTQAAYLKAISKLELQKATADKADRLFQEGIISELTMKERRVGFQETSVETKALADQLRVMGMSAMDIDRLVKQGHIDSSTPLTSSINGTIIERRINVGQIVEISDELFTVSDLSSIWIVAEVPERASSLIRVGSRAQAEVSALPGKLYDGTIVFVSDTIQAETRTFTVRMGTENSDRQLKPEMLANMRIDGKTRNVVQVPASAIVKDNNLDYAYVLLENNQLERRLVQLEEERNGKRVLIGGLYAGEKIVTEGAYAIKILETQSSSP